MPDVIHAEKVRNKDVPVALGQLGRQVGQDTVVNGMQVSSKGTKILSESVKSDAKGEDATQDKRTRQSHQSVSQRNTHQA